jgi:Fur family transcriptional regulator, ferric uptake regulator
MKRHSHRSPAKLDELAGRLRERAHKVTGPRRAILRILQDQEHPIPIARIHELVRGSGCDLATVYRSMKMLERIGMVKRFDFGDGVARYELDRHPGGHHHHLICVDCAKVVEIEECFPAELEERIAAGNGFTRVSHKLEFFGVCPACQLQ